MNRVLSCGVPFVCVFQVSEVYKLHRESYHLAQDYFDRFMATQRNVFKSTLQLIGITCLFIAAKVEVRSVAATKSWSLVVRELQFPLVVF